MVGERMSKLLVGVDCDGVLYHWERTARYMLRRKYMDEGREVPVRLHEPSDSWSAIEGIVDPDDWQWLWTEGARDGLFRYGHVVGGSLEGMSALNDFADLVIVTSRPEHAVSDTLAWLSLMLDKVDLTGIHILSNGEPKSSVRPLPDVLIDDGPHNIRDWLANTDRRAIVFDQPWNAELDVTKRNRANRGRGWQDTVRLVRAIARYKGTLPGICSAGRDREYTELDREVV